MVQAVIGFWDDLESIKQRVTSNLTAEVRLIDSSTDFYEQEGNTLLVRGTQTTRIPKNTNARTEALSDIMADISLSQERVLDVEEKLAVWSYCTLWAQGNNDEQNLPRGTIDKADVALGKLVDDLNRGT